MSRRMWRILSVRLAAPGQESLGYSALLSCSRLLSFCYVLLCWSHKDVRLFFSFFLSFFYS
jgi:hypothetical protein